MVDNSEHVYQWIGVKRQNYLLFILELKKNFFEADSWWKTVVADIPKC